MAENQWTKELQAKIIAHAWKNEEFKNKLLKNPKEALKEFGFELEGDIDVSTLQENANQFYFILPASPSEASKLSEIELESIAAAYFCWGTK